MIASGLASSVILASMLVSLGAYSWLSRREGTYINILTPAFAIQIPAYFLFQLGYIFIFGTENSTYAYIYVYGTLAVSNLAFVFAYTRKSGRAASSRAIYSYANFTTLSLACVGLACAVYAPVLFEFREFLLSPRQIYELTRTGYGPETFVSSTLAYLGIIFILFTRRSVFMKAFVVTAASVLIAFHGSKGQILNILLLLLLFQVYVRRKKVGALAALGWSAVISALVIVLFAATLVLGSTVMDAVQQISEYSDYTRNAMLVIDSHLPLQYGRLTMEANIYGLIPRVLMPTKPKDFGEFYLAEEFYPAWFDADTGSPDFGIGVQYADFGALAIIYLTLFSMLNGWLARIFVGRLSVAAHPSDFFIVAFLAGISVMPVGGAGWLFPEAIVLAWVMRYLSRIGASHARRLVRTDQSVAGASGVHA
jgi:hypothetical protein